MTKLFLLSLLLLLADHCQGQRTLVSLRNKLKTLDSRKKKESDFAKQQGIDYVKVKDDGTVETSLHDGKVELSFAGISLELRQKKGSRMILDGSIRGKASPGRLLAIMGPSGSGKSTLLDALAGTIKYSKKLSLKGLRFLNGQVVSEDSQIPAAYIQQETNFFPHMTVRETLDFRVELHMGSTLTKSQRDQMVMKLMEELNLVKSADTIVGDNKVRGLSGGERKRLTIACEMINSPSILFLDEPTSGLDSYQAQQVVETLRTLADAGKTIIAVIHQPSQNSFSMFDDLLLLSEGKQMYFGEVSKVRSYLEGLGFKAAKETGTAEHVLDCISKVSGAGNEAEQASVDRICILAENAAAAKLELHFDLEHGSKRYATTKSKPRSNIFRQFKLLLSRSVNEAFRGKTTILIKIVQQVTVGLVYGGIYKLGNNQASIQDRVGLLSLIAIGTMNMGTASTIRAFPKEKAIVTSEIANKLYRTLPYFLAKAIAEIPLIGALTTIFGTIVYALTGLQRAKGKFQTFLGLISLHAVASEAGGLMIGAVSPSSDVALALFPVAIVLNIIFDGKNISEENTPRLLRWIPKIGLVRWGFEGLALNEFDGLRFDTSGPRRGPLAKTGQDALARFGMEGKTVSQVVKAQTNIIAACWLLSFLGLSFSGQKFLAMQAIPVPPVEIETQTMEES